MHNEQLTPIPPPTPSDLERDAAADMAVCNDAWTRRHKNHCKWCSLPCGSGDERRDCDCGVSGAILDARIKFLDLARTALPAYIRLANHYKARAAAAEARIATVIQGIADNRPDGRWIDKHGACRVCEGEIPHGHTDSCDHWKLEAERDALAAFKSFVHRRLDSAGVPTHPDGLHSKEGCRIGDRLDVVIGERDAAIQRAEALQGQVYWLEQENKGLQQRIDDPRWEHPQTDLEELRQRAERAEAVCKNLWIAHGTGEVQCDVINGRYWEAVQGAKDLMEKGPTP